MGNKQSKTVSGSPSPNMSTRKTEETKEEPNSENVDTNQESDNSENSLHDESENLVPFDPLKSEDGDRNESSRLIVAAIDFGTHGSGFAFCTRAGYKKDFQKELYSWNTEINNTLKAHTTLLMMPNGKDYKSFGNKAESDYLELTREEQKKHYLFRQFKMMLFNNQNLSETLTLKDITEKELPAVDVFAAAIRYFKESVENKINAGSSKVFNDDDIHWVITVPAIWDLRSKEFMRKAAEKAGLDATTVSLALEPEAASMYCRRVPVTISTRKDGAKQIASLQTGSKYLVVDLGGGTIDVTAHEVLEDGGLKELHQATGGYYGGTCVNDEIMSFFKRLFGAPVLMTLKNEHPGDYLQLMNDIEMKKCTFNCNAHQKTYNLNIPASLMDAFEKYSECPIREDLKNTTFAKDVSIISDKMKISKELFETFF